MEGDPGTPCKVVSIFAFQSTPSAWRETYVRTQLPGYEEISIHSLRMEGDIRFDEILNPKWAFQSTPSAWRETFCPIVKLNQDSISIHSLRMEGDAKESTQYANVQAFQSTPSAWRETGKKKDDSSEDDISIHSLRMEGDIIGLCVTRPKNSFQSTPSAWRETAKLHRKAFFISPILVQSCKKGCKRLHSAPEKMVFFEKREKNLVRNLQHLSVRL